MMTVQEAREAVERYQNGEEVPLSELQEAQNILPWVRILREFAEFIGVEVSDEVIERFLDRLLR